MDAIKEYEVEVAGVACIVDRSAGKLQNQLNITSLLQVEPTTYTPEECPLCRLGIELTKPGSRVGK